MSESKTPFNKELIGLLLLFSFLVLWTIKSHAQPIAGNTYKNADLKAGQQMITHHINAAAFQF
ncbi:MAG: hypothetical protein JWO44_2070 [Bacteroidetes bacterium]|jgi:hypothetical protein|nr:hypothetical protein [Bacteroidota bacterium]